MKERRKKKEKKEKVSALVAIAFLKRGIEKGTRLRKSASGLPGKNFSGNGH
jgi:hypothetical protein